MLTSENVTQHEDGSNSNVEKHVDDLKCSICGKEYRTKLWRDKHERDKHGSEKEVSFSKPSDMDDYVSSLSLDSNADPGVVEPPQTTTPDLPPPGTTDFKPSVDQVVVMLKMVNGFLDTVIALATKLEFEYYSKMELKKLKLVAESVVTYLEHTNAQISPIGWLVFQIGMVYGAHTMALPRILKEMREQDAITKERQKEKEKT